MRSLVSLVVALGGLWAVAAEYPPILDPSPYTTWTAKSSDGLSRRADIAVPFVNSSGAADDVVLFRLDLVGDASQRGVAQGELLARELIQLVDVALPRWYISMIKDLDLSVLPTWLAAILKVKAAELAPSAINKALGIIYNIQEPFLPARLITEMEGIAEGLCNAVGPSCDLDSWKLKVKQVNMLPELIRMTCTMFGAWGPASASGNLLQLRALDFGDSPFANYTTLQVHRPTGAASFVSVSFPGLVGLITGINEKGVGLSEKVWEVYNTTTGVQPGTYEGEAVVMVSRDVVELAENRQAAEDYMRQANRTWSVFLGIGDYETQQMDICGYREDDFHAYTPETMPDVTGQQYFDSLVYVDKHPQPSHADDLPQLLAQYYGNLSMDTTRIINQEHETGDVHIAVYDYAEKIMWVSIGRIDDKGHFGENNEWKACYRPYLQFNLESLWTGEI